MSFVSKEDYNQPMKGVIVTGLLKTHEDKDCPPCELRLRLMADGPCGEEFLKSFICFKQSRVEGRDPVEECQNSFFALHQCKEDTPGAQDYDDAVEAKVAEVEAKYYTGDKSFLSSKLNHGTGDRTSDNKDIDSDS